MKVMTQLDLVPVGYERYEDEDAERFKSLLLSSPGRWVTRRDFEALEGWVPRTVRAIAERLGTEVVRGQNGFCHISRASMEEIQHAANISINQGEKMRNYGAGLRARMHGRIG